MCGPLLHDTPSHCGDITSRPRVLPEPERDWKRIDVELLPPCGLVTRAMQLAVMDPADRDDELVADPVSKGTRLCKRKVVRIRRHAAAHKARLPAETRCGRSYGLGFVRAASALRTVFGSRAITRK